jgi:hypothetical protein
MQNPGSGEHLCRRAKENTSVPGIASQPMLAFDQQFGFQIAYALAFRKPIHTKYGHWERFS